MMAVARRIYPPHPGKGVYKPENFVKFFPKVYPLTPCNYFCENGFLKIVQLMNEYMNEFVVILKSINFKNGKMKI